MVPLRLISCAAQWLNSLLSLSFRTLRYKFSEEAKAPDKEKETTKLQRRSLQNVGMTLRADELSLR